MTISSNRFRVAAVALAAAGAFGCAQAQDGDFEASVSFGLGAADGSNADRALFGQYGDDRRKRDVFGLLGVDYERRNLEKGTWAEFHGRNLLGESREVDLFWKRPGDWKITAAYGELVRYDPRMVNTGLIGSGTTTLQVVALPGGPGSGTDRDLKTKRSSYGLGLTKWINPALAIEVNLKGEHKEGSRLFGRGMNCPSPIAPGCLGSTGTETGTAVLMLPEPVDADHSQIEARVNYAVDRLRLSAGYYGSIYRNSNGALNPSIPGSLYNPLGTLLPVSAGLQAILNQPIALPPDNEFHQFDIAGNFDFSPTTRGNFKLAYARATQHDSFAGAGFTGAPAGVSHLGGEVITTRAQVGVTSRPMRKLSLLANVRYEDRDDQTPIEPYNIEGTSIYTNRRLPYRKLRGRVQANYQITSDYRGGVGADYESIDRGVFTSTSAVAGISALRQKTDETSIHAELRRRMSDNFSGGVRISAAERDGSNWLRPNSGVGVTEVADPTDPGTGFLPTSIFSPSLADRRRDKAKVFASWQPTDELSLQFNVEAGEDRFKPPGQYGLRKTTMNLFSVDWNYLVTGSWTVNGYVSQGRQTLDQARPGGSIVAYENNTTSVSVGVTGKPMPKLEVGGGLAYIDDRSVYDQTLDAFAGADSAVLLAATGGLPDIVFRQTTLNLFGRYAIDKQSAVRVDLVHQRSQFNDWTWGYNAVPFLFSDGSIVSQGLRQNATFLGVAYSYRWQ